MLQFYVCVDMLQSLNAQLKEESKLRAFYKTINPANTNFHTEVSIHNLVELLQKQSINKKFLYKWYSHVEDVSSILTQSVHVHQVSTLMFIPVSNITISDQLQTAVVCFLMYYIFFTRWYRTGILTRYSLLNYMDQCITEQMLHQCTDLQ